MSKQGCFLLEDSTGWQIAAIGADDASFQRLEGQRLDLPESLAQSVKEFIRSRGLSNSSIVIGVNSTSALARSFEVGPDDQRAHRTLKYELESYLPFAAEETVADFVCCGSQVFGVALQIETWLPIVIELEILGLRVQSIAPVALMAVQSFLDQSDSGAKELVLWQDDTTLELFRFVDQRVSKWCHYLGDPQAATRQVTVESLHQFESLRCELINVSDQISVRDDGVECDSGVEVLNIETESLAEHALQTATGVLAGTISPLVELRREELAAGDPNRAVRGSLHALYAAAAIFLVTLTSVFWIKSMQYQRKTDDFLQHQVADFREAFPQSRVPTAVVSRLRSEHAKLAGARSGQDDVAFPVSALHVLFEFLAALPQNQRYRFRECRIEDGKIDLDVELRSHNEANVLVGSFENRGFSVTAPTTVQQSPKSVTSRIFADVRTAGVIGEEL